MCGFVGSYTPYSGRVIDEKTLSAMRDTMQHRGPDGSDTWRSEDGRCALAHRRLSIIDLSQSASQPMSNNDESVIIVFNGEIYNHQAIREQLTKLNKYRWKTDHSDTEMILHAYEEWGLDALHKFYGMFSIAIYDRRDKAKPQLHLIRDRIGVKPLYISKTNQGEWVFGSEIRALLAHPAVDADVDNTAFWHYLTYIVAPAPMTMFRGIWKIPAGFVVSIDHKGHAKAKQWWDCEPSKADMYTENDLSEEEAQKELLRLLRQSIQRRMVCDVPFGVLLSGGVDSSLNVALMSELMDRPVKTFTVGYDTHEEFNEFEYARRIAKRYNTEHHETKINSQEALDFLPLLVQLQDEPIADNVCIPLYFLSKLVKQNDTTVVQVGEGADENFLGYWWCDHYRNKFQNIYQPAQNNTLPWWRKFFSKSFQQLGVNSSAEDIYIQQRAKNGEELFWGGAVCWWGELRDKLTPSHSAFQQEINCPIEGLLPDNHKLLNSHEIAAHYLKKHTGQLSDPEVLHKIPYMEHKLRLPEHLLMRVDKMTMANSIEARVPFLDHDIVDFARRLPSHYKLKDGIGKSILKKVAEPFIDEDMLYRRKQGFGAPMEKWFKDPKFGNRCLELFKQSEFAKQGYFDNEYFTGLLKHQMGAGGGYSFHLWTVMNAVLWHEVWIKGNKDCFT